VKRKYQIQELIIQRKRSTWHYGMAVIFLMMCSYAIGNWYANFNRDNWSSDRDKLTRQLSKLQDQMDISSRQINDFEKVHEINKQTIELLKATNQNLQNNINELQTDLSFYRRIIGPTQSGSSGASVAELKWGHTSEKSRYRYKMVLIQSGTNHEWQDGAIQLAIVGLQDNKVAKFFVKNAASKNTHALEYRFRYFQNLEGEVALPENFIPERVEITLLPSKEGVKQLKETFAWKLEGNDYVENQGKEKITRRST